MQAGAEIAAGPYSAKELITACAVDSLLYSRTFFPKTCKVASPQFHHYVWDAYERPENRYIGIEIYREGAKTSLARLLASKRIAYGQTKFCVFVSRSEKHAIRSVRWIRRHLLYNALWRDTFQLKLVKKSEKELDIYHGIEGHHVKVLALGISGQLRGFNEDDDRPDLIVGDDLDDEESTGTIEQRTKNQALIFGALQRSLVSPQINPDAKMIVLQTPLDKDDTIETIGRDPQYTFLRFGCFDERGESRWPEMHPTPFLLQEKRAYMARNQLSLWMREMECKVIPSETRTFRAEMLRFYDILPEDATHFMSCDPAPETPQERTDNSQQAVVDIAIYGRDVFLVHYELERGQQIAPTVRNLIRLYLIYRPLLVGIESIAYQRQLAHALKTEMYARQIFPPIQEIMDRRKKFDRIRDDIGAVAGEGRLYVKETHSEFIESFIDMPDPDWPDLLDAVAMAIMLAKPYIASYIPLPSRNDAAQGQLIPKQRTHSSRTMIRGAP